MSLSYVSSNGSAILETLQNPSIPIWLKSLSFIGGLVITRQVLAALRTMWVYLRPSKSFAKYKGTWAVVTGASWGIGHGFSLELAKRGVNVVLIARNEERLKEVAQEIGTKYPSVQTLIIGADFSDLDSEKVYQKIQEKIEGLEITILVNNVGVNVNYPKLTIACLAKLQVTEMTVEEISQIVHVNTYTPSRLTHLILPQMLQRKFGAIINLSSGSALEGQTTPLLTVYAASKAFNKKFSENLQAEVQSKGIDVLCLTPYVIASKMSRLRTSSPLVCLPDHFAALSLAQLGWGGGVVIPWFSHWIQYQLLSNFSIADYYARKLLASKRVAGMKKEQEKNAKKTE